MPTIVVVGHGMVGHRFLEEAVARGLHESHRIVVLAEECRPAYDRVHLSSFFDGASADELALAADSWFMDHGIELALGEPAAELLVEERVVVTGAGRRLAYDACVLACGWSAFVPPIDGHDAAGCFVYRTIDDLEAIRAWATGASAGIVVGGGLLGLEAANALRLLGLATSVVEMAPRLMAGQLDDGGGRALRTHVEALGIEVHTGVAVGGVATTPDGRVAGLRLAGGDCAPGEVLPADLVVFAAGIRPRDQLARAAGLAVGERGGGVVVDDGCATSAPSVYAIGEAACHAGRVYGLVAPGQVMAEVVADQITEGEATFRGADLSTRLKLLGVEVASVGDPHVEERPRNILLL